MNQYLEEYNELLSKAALEHKGNFAALASPTLNKQESITHLYKNVLSYIDAKNKVAKKDRKFLLWFNFIPRLCLLFYRICRISLCYRVRSLPKNSIFIRTWLVDSSIENDNLKDVYFGELISALTLNFFLL